MLKEIETEEPTGFFVTFLSLMAFQLGEGDAGPTSLQATPMNQPKLSEASSCDYVIRCKN